MYTAINRNKRNTVIIMALFVFIIGIIGSIISYFYNDMSISIYVVLIALVYAVIQYFIADSLTILITGAEEIQKADSPRFYRIVENIAITNGQPMPRVYIINDNVPNAFATGRDPNHAIVAATAGLIGIMDDSELEAVMAHEMGHVKNYDIRVSMITFGLVSAIGFISDIFLRTMFRGRNRDSNSSPIFMVLGVIAIILAPIIAVVVQMAVSRQREYLADASSAMTTRNPDAMIRALEKLKTYGGAMKKRSSATSHMFFADPIQDPLVSKLFSTHPPIDERIKRLKESGTSF